MLQTNEHALLGQAADALATDVVQELHAAPLPPQAVADSPLTQVPDEQHPPLHVWLAEHVVVHWPVEVLHAKPAGHCEDAEHTF